MSAVLLDEGEHATPGVVAGVLPLLECAVEEAVGRSLVDVHLQRHARGGQLALELFGDLHGGRSVGASHQQQQWSLHPRDVWLASRRSPIEADAAVEAPVQRGLVPPKQKPTVNNELTAPPSFDLRYSIAAATSIAMFSCVVFSRWGMYSKLSLRSPMPAVRPK